MELFLRAGRATGVGWCRDVPVELDRQVRHGSGEALIRREQRAIQIARGGDVQRVARGDVVSHPPGSVQERTTDRDATNVQASEPSQQFVDLVRCELPSTVESRQSRQDLGIQMRDGDERRLGVIGQPSTDALPRVTANEQVDDR
jgi:hypothetical protein